jgi:hypothetical protein
LKIKLRGKDEILTGQVVWEFEEPPTLLIALESGQMLPVEKWKIESISEG